MSMDWTGTTSEMVTASIVQDETIELPLSPGNISKSSLERSKLFSGINNALRLKNSKLNDLFHCFQTICNLHKYTGSSATFSIQTRRVQWKHIFRN
jgi:hypothetical protein